MASRSSGSLLALRINNLVRKVRILRIGLWFGVSIVRRYANEIAAPVSSTGAQ